MQPLPGCDVHLYRGPNKFGCFLDEFFKRNEGDRFPDWWMKENVYFLAGVKPNLEKRAADSDVSCRAMFTLDFDIRKILEPTAEGPVTSDAIREAGEFVLSRLLNMPPWDKMRYAVMSGNGMHVHYFGEPVKVKKEEWVAGMKDIFSEINGFCVIPPDFGCGNAGRIMRMPGSWNVKDPKNKKPVEIIAWMPDAEVFPMKTVQDRGALALTRLAAVREAERRDFAAENPDGGSDVIDLINKIPVEQVVSQLLNCRVSSIKKDGGLRFVDEAGKERGFFKHHQYNIIVHEGTALFPAPSGIGYNPLGLVKAVKGCPAREAIQWFSERSGPVRAEIAREKEEWSREHAAKEVVLFDSWKRKP